MSKDYHKILGISKDASEEDIKKAYRKLAMEHHPDRGGDEEKFKEIKSAYEALTDPQPEPHDSYNHSGNSMDDVLRAFHAHMQAQLVPRITINVKLNDAFNGGKLNLRIFDRIVPYALKAGLPHGVSFVDEIVIEALGSKRIQIQFLIEAERFRFKEPGAQGDQYGNVYFSGDLETDVEVNALDIMLGAWISVIDFTGKQLQVRIPAEFDIKHRLKVGGKGYTNWRNDKPAERGDLYLRVIPLFNDLNHEKIKQLFEQTKTKPIEKEPIAS